MPIWIHQALAVGWLIALFGLWWLIEGLGVNRRQGFGLAWVLLLVGWLLFDPQLHLGRWASLAGLIGWNFSFSKLRQRLPDTAGPRYDIWAPIGTILIAIGINVAKSFQIMG